jgi:hypothetical protein
VETVSAYQNLRRAALARIPARGAQTNGVVLRNPAYAYSASIEEVAAHLDETHVETGEQAEAAAVDPVSELLVRGAK